MPTIKNPLIVTQVDSNGNLIPPTDTLADRVDYDSEGKAIYSGWATPGSLDSAAVWRIKKLEYSGTNYIKGTFADGDINFDNVWDNRTVLTFL